MKKKESISIHIDQPCAESWCSMVNNDLGKYCPVCDKDVLDFSDLSDNEIVEILNKSNGKICGRFKNSQLDRPLIVEARSKAKHTPRFAKMLAAVTLLYSSTPLMAQEKDRVSVPAIEKVTAESDTIPKKQIDKRNRVLNSILQGNLYSANDKEALVGATVMINGTSICTYTDVDGYYKIEIPQRIMAQDSLTFIYNCIGFESQIFVVKTDEIPQMKDIYLKEDSNLLMGVVVVSERKVFPDPIYIKRIDIDKVVKKKK